MSVQSLALSTFLVAALLPAAGCGPDGWPSFPDGELTLEALESQATSSGLVVLSIPDEDPGAPFYARVGLQLLHDGDLLTIPFYRDPACIPDDFNLLEMFHFPGPMGPGAFACPLGMTGKLLIERDAPLGTFPRQVVLQGDAVPFWFVPLEAFEAAAADGVVTLPELAELSPLEGVAHRYHETLHPREGNHRIIINAMGTLNDGRSFRFHATHIDDVLRSIRIQIR
jgi:hypothetical protein